MEADGLPEKMEEGQWQWVAATRQGDGTPSGSLSLFFGQQHLQNARQFSTNSIGGVNEPAVMGSLMGRRLGLGSARADGKEGANSKKFPALNLHRHFRRINLVNGKKLVNISFGPLRLKIRRNLRWNLSDGKSDDNQHVSSSGSCGSDSKMFIPLGSDFEKYLIM
ncbi:hypothetical protein PIB30_054269 [Stylosanthes scabra]|uniref:Uncharacterized protein n=1 Tax=Stylosanthes scabra TaxID=79078 RepID=A0ABU6TIH9_9FABA|nr:hypothetical protein [Stylosanthes scabra]